MQIFNVNLASLTIWHIEPIASDISFAVPFRSLITVYVWTKYTIKHLVILIQARH